MDTVTDSARGITVIVGAGVFGTSTAYYLSLRPDHGRIVILDQHPFPNTPQAHTAAAPLGASHDVNKVVRADYTSKFHMSLAVDAIERWKSWDLISRYYHPSGWVLVSEKGAKAPQEIRQNFRDILGQDEIQEISSEEVKTAWGGAFKDADIPDSYQTFWNPGPGWAEADKAVEAVLREAVEAGVEYRQGTVRKVLLHTDASGIKGVALEDGSIITADRLVLATGAWTSALMSELEDDLGLPDNLRVESQIKAAGVCNVNYELCTDDVERYKTSPIFIYREKGEVIPVHESRILKINNTISFTNDVITASGRHITAPVAGSQQNVPQALKDETLKVAKEIMPQIIAGNSRLAFFRCCWDAITPQQHQLITRHPGKSLQNLFFAIGGSFHGWKFLPTIGLYVANVVEGLSNGKEKDETWGWKPNGWSTSSEGGAHVYLIPQRDFKDFLEKSSVKT